MKTLLIVALIVTGALAMGQGNRMPSYLDFDRNGDGQVTQIEFETTQQERIAKRAKAARMMRNASNAPLFNDLDINGDEVIDRDEFQTHQASNRKGTRQGRGNGQGMNR